MNTSESLKVLQRITGLLTSVQVTSHNLCEELYGDKETEVDRVTILNICTMLRTVGGNAFAQRTEVYKLIGMLRRYIPEDLPLKDVFVITAGTSGIVVESYEDEEEAMLACSTLDEERRPTKHYVTKTKLVCS